MITLSVRASATSADAANDLRRIVDATVGPHCADAVVIVPAFPRMNHPQLSRVYLIELPPSVPPSAFEALWEALREDRAVEEVTVPPPRVACG